MRYISAALAFLFVVGGSSPREKSGLCPKHIESPDYSAVARAAHVTGDVILDVSINTDGNVSGAVAVTGARILSESALKNVRHWTFENPSRTPSSQRLTYEYKIEGEPGQTAFSTAFFDLPDRVKVTVNPIPINRD
ncbi:MAG: TonB family protein [Candidatus Acidiferrales bacterium]